MAEATDILAEMQRTSRKLSIFSRDFKIYANDNHLDIDASVSATFKLGLYGKQKCKRSLQTSLKVGFPAKNLLFFLLRGGMNCKMINILRQYVISTVMAFFFTPLPPLPSALSP